MGDKSSALRVATGAGVPTLPRSGVLVSLDEALIEAEVLGYPLLLKANAGGGGRGIRPIVSPDALAVSFDQARAEVGAAFGDASLYLEKLLTGARHVEVQIICDSSGNSIHLYERDCSLQRRRQKVVEEAPSSFINAVTRAELAEAALRLAGVVDYISVGTVEFLVAQDQTFYFIEMNTRVQVEHGVTELVTGVDIVREQIRIAHGQPLSLQQNDVALRGAAIEVRVNAEDPEMSFMGSPGTITVFEAPLGPGIRVDSGFGSGDMVQPFYDSLVCKILAHDVDRKAVIRRLKLALTQTDIQGVTTNLSFLGKALKLSSFQEGTHHTQTLESEIASAG
jgi:acetyl-CoA carboxylase biotin carboxylase subunit